MDARAHREQWMRDALGAVAPTREPAGFFQGHFTMEVDGVSIEVTRKQVKKANCRIRGERVLLSVPFHYSMENIEKVVERLMPWITKQLASISRERGDGRYSDPNVFDVEVEGIRIQVTRKKVKNYNMRIANDGTPQMSIPEHATKEDAERMARSRIDWYREALKANHERRLDTPKEWATGETFMVWGQVRTIEVVEGAAIPSCKLADDTLQILVPIGASAEDRGYAVECFLYDELWRRLDEIQDDCERRVGRRATSISLRRMKSRWGSCTKARGTIRLNVALAECPVSCTETVLCHELCHLWEANHGPAFYARLDLACPDWKASQAWLDAHAPRYPAY